MNKILRPLKIKENNLIVDDRPIYGTKTSKNKAPSSIRNCYGFPPPLDNRRLRSRIAYSDVYLLLDLD